MREISEEFPSAIQNKWNKDILIDIDKIDFRLLLPSLALSPSLFNNSLSMAFVFARQHTMWDGKGLNVMMKQ